MLNPYLLSVWQTGQRRCISREAYIIPGNRDNKQVNKSIDGVSAINEVHTVQIRWGEVLLLMGQSGHTL